MVETIIQFRQVNDKMESVNADSGFVAVAVDNDGKITRLTSSVKPIVDTQKSIDMQSLAKVQGLDRRNMFKNVKVAPGAGPRLPAGCRRFRRRYGRPVWPGSGCP